MSQRPTTVRRAVQLLVGLVALAAVAILLAAVLPDSVLDGWTGGRSADADIKEPAYLPVAVVLFLVFAGLVWVLIPFLRAGANWARHSMAMVVALVAVATLAGLRTDPPAPFVVVAVLSLALDAAVLVLLWHPDTTGYIRRREGRVPTSV
ncbi:hypothetical protein [Nocardioides sp. SYSU DS0663]|uniref:hypothetical protein n=1 Tax=Nocardioides sp. SYSU DS0663 TaxID=3416445 RepID=UPI003F4C7BAF